MIKKIYLFTILLSSIFIASFFWKIINIPLESPLEYGDGYFINNYNPLNDTLRFIIFITISLLPYLFFYLFFFKSETNKLSLLVNISLKDKNIHGDKVLDKFYSIIFLGLIINFFLIDFNWYVSPLDIFHDGLWLTASSNFLNTEKFWSVSYIDRGLFGNFYPLILWKLINISSIGSVKLTTLILILINKILLLTLAKQITDNINFSKIKKKYYFLLLAIFFISLPEYSGRQEFVQRSVPLILFFNIFLHSLKSINKYNFSGVILGLFSAISLMWFIDIGAYINFLIICIIFYFLIRQNLKITGSIFLGIIMGWVITYFLLPETEFINFINNTLNIYSTVDQIHGLIHPIPFFTDDARATKTMLFYVFSGTFVINIFFSNKDKFSNQNKVFFIFLFIASLVVYKSALSRSDSGHIRTSSGPILIIFSTYILYYIINFINENKINIFFIKFKKDFLKNAFIIIFIFTIFVQFDLYKINNILQAPNKIKNLIYSSDNNFLTGNKFKYRGLINYYSKISSNENCIQIFTDEVALPYLMKKKTCTKYYQMWIAAPKHLQEDFIKELKIKKPKLILYKSDIFSFNSISNRLKLTNSFISKNYILHSVYEGWTFMKLK